MAPKKMLPSAVFAQRLRETRQARGLTQTELAERMTDAGRPMSKPALLRIENGTRGLSLDEALAFAQVLNAVPAHLLNPPEGTVVAPVDWTGYDGEGLRLWLVTGVGGSVWPEQIATDDDRALAESWFEGVLSSLAVALVDANRVDDKEGVNAIGRRIVIETRNYLAAIDTPPRGGS